MIAETVRADEFITVTRLDGRAFNVRLLRHGDRYGLNRCLEWPNVGVTDPELRARFMSKLGVEIHDARLAGNPNVDTLGQFTGGRYYLDDFMPKPGRPSRLQMDGGVPEWHLDASAYLTAVEWVRERLADRGY